MISYMRRHEGFALPTVLLMSLAILIVIAALLATTSSSFRNAVTDHYQSLAEEAAEAGTAYATACLTSAVGHAQTWGAKVGRPNLTPAGDCTGTSNANCTSGAVYADSSVRTCFSVGDLIYSTNFAAQISSTGYAVVYSNGNPVKTYSNTTMKVNTWPTDTNSTSVGSGIFFTCAAVNYNPYCFGHDGLGQLGDGNLASPSLDGSPNSTSSYDSAFPVKVGGDLYGKGIVRKVAAGGYHACALTSGGQVYCWGFNRYGELGTGDTTDSATPVQVSLPGTATDVTAGQYTSCAIVNSKIYCWGRNDSGQVGDDSGLTSVFTPTAVASGGTYALPAGYSASTLSTSGGAVDNVCAIADDAAYCWGNNLEGQIGNGTKTTTGKNGQDYTAYAPTAVVSSGVLAGRTITSISLGGHGSVTSNYSLGTDTHVCVSAASTATDGAAYCWGNNGNGQLGNNSTTDSTTPVAVNTSGVLKNLTITQVRVGSYQSCALSSLGAVYCWGKGSSGQLGNGTNTSAQTTPVAVTTDPQFLDGTNVKTLGGGVNRSCAITTEQHVYCWGVNQDGQIGDGTHINRNVPTESLFLRPANNQYLF